MKARALNFVAFQPLASSEPTRNARLRRGRVFNASGDDILTFVFDILGCKKLFIEP